MTSVDSEAAIDKDLVDHVGEMGAVERRPLALVGDIGDDIILLSDEDNVGPCAGLNVSAVLDAVDIRHILGQGAGDGWEGNMALMGKSQEDREGVADHGHT